jgi:hypothetical protein
MHFSVFGRRLNNKCETKESEWRVSTHSDRANPVLSPGQAFPMEEENWYVG